MGSIFRSEDMTLCSLYLQSAAAYECLAALGELGVVQFKDLNSDVQAFQRKFVSDVRRCEEMERQLRYFERELYTAGWKPEPCTEVPPTPQQREIVDLEALFERLESELREFGANIDALKRNRLDIVNLKHVLLKTDDIFNEARIDQLPANADSSILEGTSSDARPNLRFLTGVIPQDRLVAFQRLLWFACRGNVYLKLREISELDEEPRTERFVKKQVFIVYFQGDQLEVKVKKICDAFRATLYPCSENAVQRQELLTEVNIRLEDLKNIISRSEDQRDLVFKTVSQYYKLWSLKIMKVKAIYHTMNMLHTEGQNYVAECWVPVAEVGTVQMSLQQSTQRAGISAPSLLHPIEGSSQVPPTYFRTNKFTNAFQAIINAYGVATYKEVNPVPFSIITFPFLFSVMFGDAGHGLLIFLLALWMVVKEKQLAIPAKSSEIFSIIFGGRYLILMMGLFSMYSGLIYNDTFSKSFNIFGSKWHIVYSEHDISSITSFTLDPNDTRVYQGSPYEFGVDPVWDLTQNEITFTNSFKKKISVIFGIAQMLTGIILSIYNHVYFKQYLNIFCNFLPQMLFLIGIFGYLVALLFVKWLLYTPYHSASAPNLLIGFINMFLFSHSLDWYPGQMFLEMALVVIAGLSAIWMLLSKPLILLYLHKRSLKRSQRLLHDDDMIPSEQINDEGYVDDDVASSSEDARLLSEVTVTDNSIKVINLQVHPEFELGEIFIHQAIHMIEFCLGCISHTASYLRLWALSLAHAQLSQVLWTMILHMGFTALPGYAGSVMLFCMFVPFAFLTVAILLMMEGLSAFLHTLRLHWVEFQSKFYQGEGIIFQPFSFQEILDQRSTQ